MLALVSTSVAVTPVFRLMSTHVAERQYRLAHRRLTPVRSSCSKSQSAQRSALPLRGKAGRSHVKRRGLLRRQRGLWLVSAAGPVLASKCAVPGCCGVRWPGATLCAVRPEPADVRAWRRESSALRLENSGSDARLQVARALKMLRDKCLAQLIEHRLGQRAIHRVIAKLGA